MPMTGIHSDADNGVAASAPATTFVAPPPTKLLWLSSTTRLPSAPNPASRSVTPTSHGR